MTNIIFYRHLGTGAKLLLVILAVLLLLMGYGYHAWQSLLQAQGIEYLEWQGLGLSDAGIGLDRLELARRDANGTLLRIRGERILLRWPSYAGGHLRWPGLRVRYLVIDWLPPVNDVLEGSVPVDWAALCSNLAWQPEQVHLERFLLILPCPAGRCIQEGGLDIDRPPDRIFPLAAQLRLWQREQQVLVDAQLFEEAGGWRLRVRAQLDQQKLLHLDSRLSPNDGNGLWQGHLKMPVLADTQGLVTWLNQWLPAAQRLLEAPAALHLQADWMIRLAPGDDWLDPQRLLKGSGKLNVQAHVPQPWSLFGLGSIEGNLAVQLDGNDGIWQPRQLRSDLRLSGLRGDWLRSLPGELRPMAFSLRSEPLESSTDAITGLRLVFASEGASDLKLDARLDLLGTSPWVVKLSDASLRFGSRGLTYQGWRAEGLVLELPLVGQVDQRQVRLDFAQGAEVRVATLADPLLQLSQVQVGLAGTHLEIDYQSLAVRLNGPLQVQVRRLRQARLKPLGWSFKGQVDTTLEQTSLTGWLDNSAGLAVNVRLQRNLQTPLKLSASLREVFFRTGNPLAETLVDWPALFELNNGHLSARASWKQTVPPALDLDLILKGLDGIYDRSELKGLGGKLNVQLRGNQLSLDCPSLTLNEASLGVPLGPLIFQGSYQTSVGALASGRLSWRVLRSGLFGGWATIPAGAIHMGQAEQKFSLRLEGLQLGDIFRVYPAEGLAGRGTLDGELPLMLNRWRPSVAQGQVRSRGPGYLQFRSEKIRALGRGSPGMKLVADALNDFHYDLLESSVDYHEDGKLLLGLRLQGRNPDVEKGRSINLSVNLEEDIPTLMTSLQLGEWVSETIRKRVQERMQKRKASAL